MPKIIIKVTDFERQLFRGLQNHPMTEALQLSLETLADRDATPFDKAFKQIAAEVGKKYPSAIFFRSNFGRMMNVYMQHVDMDSLMVDIADPELQAIMGEVYPQGNPKFFRSTFGPNGNVGYHAIMNYEFGAEKLPTATQMRQFFNDQMCRFHPYTSVTNYYPHDGILIVTRFPSLEDAVNAIVRDVDVYEKIGRGIFTRAQSLLEMEEIIYTEPLVPGGNNPYTGRTYRVRYDRAPLDSAMRRLQMDSGTNKWFEVEATIDEIKQAGSGQDTRRVNHYTEEFRHVFDKAVRIGVFAAMGPSSFYIHPIEPHI